MLETTIPPVFILPSFTTQSHQVINVHGQGMSRSVHNLLRIRPCPSFDFNSDAGCYFNNVAKIFRMNSGERAPDFDIGLAWELSLTE